MKILEKWFLKKIDIWPIKSHSCNLLVSESKRDKRSFLESSNFTIMNMSKMFQMLDIDLVLGQLVLISVTNSLVDQGLSKPQFHKRKDKSVSQNLIINISQHQLITNLGRRSRQFTGQTYSEGSKNSRIQKESWISSDITQAEKSWSSRAFIENK